MPKAHTAGSLPDLFVRNLQSVRGDDYRRLVELCANAMSLAHHLARDMGMEDPADTRQVETRFRDAMNHIAGNLAYRMHTDDARVDPDELRNHSDILLQLMKDEEDKEQAAAAPEAASDTTH
jgi:hypothetical protein